MSAKIRRIVKKILAENNVTSFPIPIEKILKKYNITLRYSIFEDKVSGLLYKKNDKDIISVNSLHPSVRQRFTIAHELGHFFLEHQAELFIDKGNLYRDNRSKEGNIQWEKDANKFAAELLMPENFIRELIENEDLEDAADLENLASIIDVSSQALTYRLANLGLISLY